MAEASTGDSKNENISHAEAIYLEASAVDKHRIDRNITKLYKSILGIYKSKSKLY